MSLMAVECPRCRDGFEFERLRANQKLARMRCPLCKFSWITRLPPHKSTACNPDVERQKIVNIELDQSIPATRPPIEAEVSRTLKNTRMSQTLAHQRVGFKFKRFSIAACATAGLLTLFSVLLAQGNLIVTTAPFASGLYAAVGFPVNVTGLDFRNVQSVVSDDSIQRTLLVDGTIVNSSSKSLVVPDLRISIKTENATEIYHWNTSSQKKQLIPGESTPFQARLLAAPTNGRKIMVQFVQTEDATLKSIKKPAAK